jgi:tetratricopeptide (TPR) repeat protein
LIPKYRIELANWKARRNDLGLALEQLELTAQHYEALSEQQSGAISRLYQQRMAEVRLLRADFLFAAGETRRALESYQALYNYFYELGGGKTVNLATCLHRLGHTMNHLGESLEAERYLHDAELMLQQIAGANHYRLASLRERVSAMPGG